MDWREVRGTHAPFTILMPAKPTIQTRQVELAGMKITMSMTATASDELSFGVASAQVPNPAGAMPALEAMKNALVRNIDGSIQKQTPLSSYGPAPAFDIEATGKAGPRTNSKTLVLYARFVAKDQRIYQVAVIGPEAALTRDIADTFLSSFKLQ